MLPLTEPIVPFTNPRLRAAWVSMSFPWVLSWTSRRANSLYRIKTVEMVKF
jgi:hypothetical protein